jgi:hypothetical protein
VHSLPTPAPESGEGVLTLAADPYAALFVNGAPQGETPRECQVTAGAYQVRAVHPERGAREARLVVKPGQRTTWTADFLAGP